MKLTERQKNCPYCQEPKITFIGEDGVLYQVSEDAFTTPKLITITNGRTHIVEIEYCPKCGRSLKEEEEKMTNGEFINKAKYIVAKYSNENILKPEQGLISENEVFVAWYAKVLQNHKALLATLIEGDQHYYEATYNGDKKQLYLDVYDKQENKCFEVE